MLNRLFRFGAVAVLASSAAMPALAADVAHVRGTIASVEGSHVVIKTNEGKDVGLTLGDEWKIGGVVAAGMADIKQGSFIGTANMPSLDGNEALEIVVFPEAMRGTGEGDYGWDLKPKSAMTNATVAQKVDSVTGSSVELKYKGGEKKVTIPPTTPIVSIVAASREDLVAGAKVFAAGPMAADGMMMSGGHLVVGKNGATPPM